MKTNYPMSSLMITRFCSMRLLPTLSLFHSMKWPTRTSVSLLIHLVLILLLLLKLTCGVYCQINEKVYVPLCLWTVSVEYWFILTFSLVSFAEACCFKGIRETLKALVSLCISRNPQSTCIFVYIVYIDLYTIWKFKIVLSEETL